ncbi:MAG TPA: T9SS type A sorting domain-containing protein [Bacteroidales bacterium]|nr:T9SS type A sorting domain-containing protein [Bacteroidales bacterium]
MKKTYNSLRVGFISVIIFSMSLSVGALAPQWIPVSQDGSPAKRQNFPVVTYNPDSMHETIELPNSVVRQLTIGNTGDAPMAYKLEIEYLYNGVQKQATTPFAQKPVDSYDERIAKVENSSAATPENRLEHDAGVIYIMQPTTGRNLGWAEPVIIEVANFGEATIKHGLPYEVSWPGFTYNDTCMDWIAPGQVVLITLPLTANLSTVNGYYLFEACVSLPWDQNPYNDCSTKEVVNIPPRFFTDNLYTTGCAGGDGLIYWSLANVHINDIPCTGNPSFYHGYLDSLHLMPPGEYELTVKADYNTTYFDVWIDYNNDMDYTADECVLDDALCAVAHEPYTFTITIPDSIPAGKHYMRYRTNWNHPVYNSRNPYTYGNCCDFTMVSRNVIDGWLSLDKTEGTIQPGENTVVEVTFQTENLTTGDYVAQIRLNNSDPYNASVEIPVSMTVTGPAHHFGQVWQAATNPMTIFVLEAEINDLPMEAGDEVGFFDVDPQSGDTICVAAGKLTESLAGEAYLELVASMNTATGQANGFTPGHTLLPKLWNESTGEVATVEMVFPFPGHDEQYAANGHTYVRLYGEESGVGIYKITNNDSGLQVAPNPASGNLSVSFNLHEQSSILISLTDSRGHEMALLQKDHLNSGVQQFNLDVSRFAPGLYLLTLKSTDNGRLIGSEKVILR